MSENRTLKFMHQDHLNGTSLVTESDGSANGTMKYYPFGVCRNSPENFPTDRLFTGKRLDETGLYYYGARYYDATMGRFISADTIIPDPMNPQAFNRYSYCLNNPLKYVDPSGHTVYIGDYDTEYLEWIMELIEEAGGHVSQCSTSIANTYASREYQAFSVLQEVAPELTGYLEAAEENISIEWNSALDPLESARWHAGIGGSSWIYLNTSLKYGDVNTLASAIGHEGFHGAIWIGAGHYRRNFAANEAFAYSFGYQVDQKLGITSHPLSSKMSDIDPWFSGDLNERLDTAAFQLWQADRVRYGRQNFWDNIVSIFHYQSRPMKIWSNSDKYGSSFLTVAKTVWIR